MALISVAVVKIAGKAPTQAEIAAAREKWERCVVAAKHARLAACARFPSGVVLRTESCGRDSADSALLLVSWK